MKAIALEFGNVTEKAIITKNDFVSHMVEHIAWRLGAKITLQWDDENWRELGVQLGAKIAAFTPKQRTAAALSMIDDGSAEVVIDLDGKGLTFDAVDTINRDWFLSLRCEQAESGKPLLELLEGLAEGADAAIRVTVCTVEDPHHTWEGVYRSVGIAFSKIYTPTAETPEYDDTIVRSNEAGEISVKERSLTYALVSRGTAESGVTVGVDFTKTRPNACTIDVADSIDTSGMKDLLELFAGQADCTVQVNFRATVLSSSHVVAEDIGLVMGRALLEILKLRMGQTGVNGAGSSIQTVQDLDTQAIRVGISVEGRKFIKIAPFTLSYQEVRERLLLGKDVFGDLRSEDLDDFVDGLAGGMSSSIVVHVAALSDDADSDWKMLISSLGKAIREVFGYNPYRKGVPPGVKATLS